MPISPAEGERYVDEIRRIYADAETSILETVARRLERGIDEDGWAEKKLAEIQRLRAEVEATVADLQKQQAGVTEAVGASYSQGADAAVVELQGLGRRVSAGFGRTHTAGVEALARKAADNLAATHLRILREPLDIYRRVVHEASGFTLTGVERRRQAAQRVLNALADKGISGFVDSAGRSWDMATYAEMATRSATGQAAVQGHIDRLTDEGYELFIVSDSPEECPVCRPWEGAILARTEEAAARARLAGINVKGTIAEATAAGLFHANCTHNLSAYIHGLTRPMQVTTFDSAAAYAERQKQRQIERSIRQWKRREAVAITPEDKRKATAKVADWRADMADFIESTGRLRQRQRESITRAR